MAKSITIFFFLFIFAAAHVAPFIESPGTVGKAYAGGMMGDIKIKRKFKGNIEEIDQNLKTMAVIKKEGNRDFRKTFTFGADTPVSFGAENKNISDLKTGDKVLIRYIITDDRNVVSSIVLEK